MRRASRTARWSAVLVACALGLACRTAPGATLRQAGRLGTVRIFPVRSGDPAALVFLFSDEKGWSRTLDTAAEQLNAHGASVVGVDLPQYLAGLAASDDGCHYVIAEIEALSQELQREQGFPSYRGPILAGSGAGGALAYAALAQSPAATVTGAASVDPADVLRTKVPLCAGAPSQAASGGGFSYGPRKTLPGWWRVSVTDPTARGRISAAHGELSDARGDSASTRLSSLLETVLVSSGESGQSTISDLPLIEYPSEGKSDLMAVIYSGDGGWRDLDKQIGEILAKSGVPVVGVDSLRYFWRAKSPEQIASDLAEIIRVYGQRWQARDVILAGYSFGADILPFAMNRLPEDVRDRVVQISLLGLAARADFEIRVTGWLGVDADPDAPPILPELQRIDPALVQCFYGEEEDDTLCRAPELAQTELIRTSGSHHFDGNYPALAERILTGAQRRASERGPVR